MGETEAAGPGPGYASAWQVGTWPDSCLLKMTVPRILVGAAILAASAIGLCSRSAAANRCSGAEAGAARLKDWSGVAKWHERFSQCDDGCVAEQLDFRLTRLLASDWPSVVDLGHLSEQHPRFKHFVLKHLGGDAEPKQLRKVRANAIRSCPAGFQDFCREIRAAVSRGPADPLCHGRPRCSIADRRPAGNPDAGHVVVVRLAAPVEATANEDRCDRREYWLSRPAGDRLLAVDCEVQWGAEHAGPASLSVAGNLATFRYVEFLANDACEIVNATLRLPQARIESHSRHWGTVAGNQCRPSGKAVPLPTSGSGTLGHPVLVLHRP
jgi:hypothetical protein